MPFVGPDAQLDRKRRWRDDAEEEMIYRLYKPQETTDFILLDHPHHHHHSLPQPNHARKILPLSNKRARIAEDEIHIHENSNNYTSRRRCSQQLRTFHDQPSSSSPFLTKTITTPMTTNTTPAKVLLTPCHICHRKPTKKSHLDSFAECQGCGERTCFVCIRQCNGWSADETANFSEQQEVLSRSFHMDDVDDDMAQHQDYDDNVSSASSSTVAKGWHAQGHRSVVCSRCCVERGQEGDVVCLGCLSTMEGA